MQYPIVVERHLGVPPKRLFRRVRQESEIPQISNNQVLVYRVGAQQILDNIRLPMDHDTVVNANHVAVVDTSRRVPVEAMLSLPSQEGDTFTARVLFFCHVVDPITVAVAGVNDASEDLTSYLRGRGTLAELGLKFELSDINELRPLVSSTIEAMFEVEPPEIPGLDVFLRGVELLTPDDLVAFQRELRSVAFEHELDAARQDNAHALEVRDQVHQIGLHDRQRRSQREQFEELDALIGTSPDRSRRLGIVRGEESTSSYAQSLEVNERARRDQERAIVEAQLAIVRNLEQIGMFRNLTLDENALLQGVLARAGISAPTVSMDSPQGLGSGGSTGTHGSGPLLVGEGEDEDD